MLKNGVISLLAAVILTDALADKPWWSMSEDMKIAVILGFATILFIFLLFSEKKLEEYRRYKQRVQQVQMHVNALMLIRLEDKHEESEQSGQAYIDTEENNIIGWSRLEDVERGRRG